MPKLFGCGLPKTATYSLSLALKILNYRVIHNPTDADTIGRLKRGQFMLPVLFKAHGILDLPSAVFFEDFDEHYPRSRFILTTREKEPWLDSCESWCRYFDLGSVGGIARQNERSNDSLEFLHSAMFGCVNFNRRRWSRTYDAWNARVVRHFKGTGRLLILPCELKDPEKWDRLCGFLGVRVPMVDYPRENCRSVIGGVSGSAD